MRILLDTHTLLWAAKGTLAHSAKSMLEDVANELYFSPVNLWEIELKHATLNYDLKALHQNLIHNGYRELAVTARHVLEISQLPLLHNDPFDRILLAQALCEGMLLLTTDKQVKQYSKFVDCVLGFD